MPTALTLNDTILDEEFRAVQTGTGDDSDASPLPTAVTDLIDAQSDPADFISSSTGFPQSATSAVSSSNPVTDYYLTVTAGGVATDLYVGTEQVYLYASGDNNLIFGRIGGATGDIVLAIAVDDSDVANASIWTTLYAPITNDGQDAVDSADQIDLTGLVTIHSDFSTINDVPFDSFGTVKSGQDAFAPVADTDLASTTDVELLITGYAGSTVGTVNVSTTGLGVNAQHIDKLESLRIDIVAGLDTSGALDSTFVHNAANISYDDHVNAVSASFVIQQLNPTGTPATASVFAFQDEDTDGGGADSFNYQGAQFPTKAISDPGTAVQIDADDVQVMRMVNGVLTNVAGSLTIVADGMGVKISGLLASDLVKFSTDGGEFDRFVVTNTSTIKGPSTFDIGAIHVTVREGGSDTDSADLGAHLIFQDDGPTIALSNGTASVTVDETALGTPDSADFSGLFGVADYGADGEGSLAYTLGISGTGDDSTLVDTASGNGIFLYMDGIDVVGRVGSGAATADPGGAVAFRISVDTDGNVAVDQSLAVMHGNTSNDNETVTMSLASLVTLTATAYDNEGANSDSASATANIAASFTFHDDGPSIESPVDAAHDFVVAANTNGATGSNHFDLDGGADGLDSYVFTGTQDSSGDYRWTWNSDHTVITETYKGANLFQITLDSSDGSYSMQMLGTLPASTDTLDTSDIKAGGPGTHFIDVGIAQNGNFIRIDGTPGFINESHAFVGVNNGNFDTGESMMFTMLNSTKTADLDFYGMEIGGKSAQGSSYHWVAYLNGVEVDNGDTGVIGKGQKALIDPGNAGADQLVDMIVVTKTGGNANKVGLADIDILVPPVDAGFVYNVQVTDGDGDHHGSTFTAFIDADGGGINSASVIYPL